MSKTNGAARRLCAVLAIAAGCSSEPTDPDLAKDAFQSANTILHELHLDALELPAWPTTDYEHVCSGGGRVVMRSEVDAQGAPVQLFHTFEGCVVDDWTFDGQLDYLELTPCSNGTYSYAMRGRLETARIGDCVIEAQHTCGGETGIGCGVEL